MRSSAMAPVLSSPALFRPIMYRLLRSTGMATGLFAVLASCASDRPLAARLATLASAQDAAVHEAFPAIRISEIHFDNAGTDAGEAIEISGPAGSNVEGWRIVLYNGSNGTTYEPTRTLHGTLPATCESRGVAVESYPVNGIQNGDPDGIALVDAGGHVVEFLSYEGAFAATNGPALGLTSRNIGVAEGAATPIGFSLQRTHLNTWIAPKANNFGMCNDLADLAAPVVDVAIVPASASIFTGDTKFFAGSALASENNVIPGVAISWSTNEASVVTVDAIGLATGVGPGDAELSATAPNGVSSTASVHVEESVPLPPSLIRVSEFHYDNAGTDAGEFVEIEGPAGTNLTGWSLVLYNGNGGASYHTRTLAGVLGAACGGRGVASFAYGTSVAPIIPSIQNGDPDGIALVNNQGQLVEFISYGGVFRATNGPALGRLSADIGVKQSGSAVGLTLQRDNIGWYGPSPGSMGGCNVPPTAFLSIVGRHPSDPPLPVDFEDQLFMERHDGRGNRTSVTGTWTNNAPAVASIDARGVVRALAAGTAMFRATSDEGLTTTISLPTHVATASTTARYVGNTEFGIPTDADPSDDFIVTRAQYTASYNSARGIPNWVSANLEQTHFGEEDRCDCFTFDPALPASFTRYNTADYTGAGTVAGYGIDRGHLVRSFDRTAGSLDNATTFYFTNIVPQASDNNQGPWGAMEIAVGNRARFQNKEVYIIAGASGRKGTVKNEGMITIPTHVWKVVVIMPRDAGLANVDSYDDVEVIAVIMPNDPGIENVPWETYKTTINAVEALSGYNVLSLLPKKIEAVVEAGMQDEMALVDQLVTDGKINKGTGNSLQSKLEAAAESIERGNNNTATNQLEALLNELQGLVGAGRLSEPDVQPLLAAVLALISAR